MLRAADVFRWCDSRETTDENIGSGSCEQAASVAPGMGPAVFLRAAAGRPGGTRFRHRRWTAIQRWIGGPSASAKQVRIRPIPTTGAPILPRRGTCSTISSAPARPRRAARAAFSTTGVTGVAWSRTPRPQGHRDTAETRPRRDPIEKSPWLPRGFFRRTSHAPGTRPQARKKRKSGKRSLSGLK